MYIIDHCPLCDSKNIKQTSATFDSWAINRFLRKTPDVERPPVFVNHCQECGFACSNYRFDKEEENQYYENYMTGEYVDSRGIHGIAEFYHSKPYIIERQNKCWSCVEPYANEIKSVIDFGGNTGAMIPEQFQNIERFVLDVELRNLDNGVKCITNTDNIEVDLVICAHTLEHVSDLRSILIQIKSKIKKQGFLYLEIPDENPGSFPNHLSWHEHINLFNIECASSWLKKEGFEILFEKILDYPGNYTRSFAIVARYSDSK